MSREASPAAIDAAAAARDADDVPEYVLEGTPIGRCQECGHQFSYGAGTGHRNLDPCPSCDSQRWGKWGYDLPNRGRVPLEDLDGGDAA